MGLYDDDDKAVTTGDINDKLFFYAKAYAASLDDGLKSRQPEGALKDWLKEAIKAHDAALAKYPAHEELKQLKEKALALQAKINPKAEWSSWKPDWPWDSPYIHGWVEYHWAKCAEAAGDWATVYEQARAAGNHLGEYGAQKNMKGWPQPLQTWVVNAKTEVDALWEKSRKHR